MFHDLLQEAYGAMRHNRRRTMLTMLGMAWGIATVVMLLAYGDGFGRACANIFANFGSKLVIVVRKMMWRRLPPIFRRLLISLPKSASRPASSTTPEFLRGR
jgi:ABC-type antimicrobial peptide transport system permease subunit